MAKNRDEFNKPTRDTLAKRAAYVCSNPTCMKMTVAPSSELADGVLYFGRAAHITAAAEGGPRFDPTLTPEERSHISNGIFLCANCADMIDDNDGSDFTPELLRDWKAKHDEWVMANLNKGFHNDHEAVQMLRQMSGGNSTLYLHVAAGAIGIRCDGDHPIRDLQLTITDVTESRRKHQVIEDTQGANMSLRDAVSFLAGAVVYSQFIPVLDVQGKTSNIGISVPPLQLGGTQQYSFRALALNGSFHGAIYLFGHPDGKLLRAEYGFAGDRLIHEFPSQYPKLGESRDPDWQAFQ